ncbi:N-acetlytransferase [Vairimorpha necatrix]|uniref:N-acetlytransferase n=1 Tax=Vairimorpha necatrix TaxID=6039 RepID=A0AAX4JDC5_9MICR
MLTDNVFSFTVIFFQYSFVKSQDTFHSYFTDEQILKSLDLIKNDSLIVHKAFSENEFTDKQLIEEASIYEIFKIKRNDELVASVYFKRNKYYTKISTLFRTYIKEEEGVEMYSLFVNDAYKGQGYARKLIYYALKSLKLHYNFDNNFIIGLHLNEADKFMNISFAMYYAINFDRGSFVDLGPSDFAPKFEEYHNFKDPIMVAKNYNICKNEGCYFAMFGRYCNLLPFNPIRNKTTKNNGENLRKILKNRKNQK